PASVAAPLALRCTIGGNVASTAGVSPARVCSSLAEKPRSTLNSVLADDTQGKDQPIRRLYACNFSSEACETKTMVTSRAWRCERMPLTASALEELGGSQVW